jgi:triacylglycerol lipase
MRQLGTMLTVICGAFLASLTHSGAQNVVANRSTAVADQVVLLHGLARSATSMSKLAAALQSEGYSVCNVDYPSRDHSIVTLTTQFVIPAIDRCFPDRATPVHFVTHSLGGILVRQLVSSGRIDNIGRVVMLSPPNGGSEVVDKLGNLWAFEWLNGPAGLELGTLPTSTPLSLGPATFEVGVITGVRTINPLLSTLIPGDDDGKVGVASAKLAGMADFLIVRCSHPFIMKSDRAIAQSLHFLRHGTFLRTPAMITVAAESEEPEDCWD